MWSTISSLNLNYMRMKTTLSLKNGRATKWLLLLLTLMMGQTTWAEQIPTAPDQLFIECNAGVDVYQSGLITDGSSNADSHYQQLKEWGCKAIYKVSIDRLCTWNEFYLTWEDTGPGGPYESMVSPILRMPAPQGFFDMDAETTLYDQNGNKVESGRPGYPRYYGPNDDIVIYINSITNSITQVPGQAEETISSTGINCYIGFKNVDDASNYLFIYGSRNISLNFDLKCEGEDELSQHVKINLFDDSFLEANSVWGDNDLFLDYDPSAYYYSDNEYLWFTIECEPGFTVNRVESNGDLLTFTKTGTSNGKTYYKVNTEEDISSLCHSFTIYLDYTEPQAPSHLNINSHGGILVNQHGLINESQDANYLRLKNWGCKAVYIVDIDRTCAGNDFYLEWEALYPEPLEEPMLYMPAPQGFYDTNSEEELYDQNGNAVGYYGPGYPSGYGPNDNIVIYIIPDYEDGMLENDGALTRFYFGFKDVGLAESELNINGTNRSNMSFYLQSSPEKDMSGLVSVIIYDGDGNYELPFDFYENSETCNCDLFGDPWDEFWFTIECVSDLVVEEVEINGSHTNFSLIGKENGKNRYKVSCLVEEMWYCPDIYISFGQAVSPDADFVDLGLPSGTKWAKYNIEASSPEKVGKYYAWGEKAAKSTYTWKNYKYCSGTATTCKNIGDDISKNPAYDIAYSLYQEAGAGIPTAQQWNELISKCTWKESTKNKVKGYTVTGPNGNTIFLPFSGCSYDGKDYGIGNYAYYWTSNNVSSNKSKARGAYIKTGVKSSITNLNRRTGVAIRPVITPVAEETAMELVDLGLSVKWASQNLGADTEKDYGDYFAWGETEPKSSYTWKNYKYANGTAGSAYNIGTDISQTTYDAAFSTDEGLALPTSAQWKELIEKCTWKEETVGGTKGFRVTGPSGKSIFLPFSGCSYDGKQVGTNANAYYWTSGNSASYTSKAKATYLKSGATTMVTSIQRRTGAAIRPVECTVGYVDLNLSSGNLWATCNVGAGSEEQAGNYYAWGEIAPKSDYTWKNYVYANGTATTVKNIGSTINGNAKYDPAVGKQVQVAKGNVTYTLESQMPSYSDLQELYNSCNCKEETVNGVKGIRFSRNGKSIFLPYAGSWYDGKKHDVGVSAYYWSGKINSSNAQQAGTMYVKSANASMTNCRRRTGMPVRPVFVIKSTNANSTEFDTDGIDNVQHATNQDDAIYNLQGIKMQGELKPGIYIQNGKKFVVN